MENHGSRILIQRGSRCGLINVVHLLLRFCCVPKKSDYTAMSGNVANSDGFECSLFLEILAVKCIKQNRIPFERVYTCPFSPLYLSNFSNVILHFLIGKHTNFEHYSYVDKGNFF